MTILNSLNALSEQVPGMHKKAQAQQQAASDILLQRDIAKAPAGASAQQMATQKAYQAGKQLLATRQAATQQAQQVRQQALQQRTQNQQQALAEKQLAQQQKLEEERRQQLAQVRQEERESQRTLTVEELELTQQLQTYGIERRNDMQIATIKQRKDLARIGHDVQGKLLNSRLAFEKDSRGRKFTNERQLADWIVTNSKDRTELTDRLQKMQEMGKRKLMLMQHMAAEMESALERNWVSEQGDLDRELKRELTYAAQAMRERIRREKARARNRTAMSSSMIKIGGALVFAGATAATGGGALIAAGGAGMAGGMYYGQQG
jgi:hypothetical protein